MADDIDDLLNEVESKYCSSSISTSKVAKAGHNTQSSVKEKGKRSKTKEADLDDLINEIFDDGEKTGMPRSSSGNMQQQNSSFPGSSSQSQGVAKCFPVYIGGSNCSVGSSTSVSQRACDRLRCTDCDFRISTFDNKQWHSSTDYLFLRNNMPDYERLKSKLVSKKGYRAYACQCKWRSVRDLTDLQKELDLKWVCGKH